jgi:hypothetical protein
LDFASTVLWPVGAIVIFAVTTALVLRKWRKYSLPINLIPLDVLTLLLLIDLNIKSNNSITLDDFTMKIEAIAFTALLAVVLFVPVLWRLVFPSKKSRSDSS